MTKPNPGVGKRLASIIPEGMKKEKFAELLGLKPTQLSDRLYGRAELRATEIRLACLLFDVAERWLRTGAGPRKVVRGVPVISRASMGLPVAPAEAGDDDVLTAHLARLESEGAVDRGQMIVGGFLVTVEGPITPPAAKQSPKKQSPKRERGDDR